MGKIYQALEKSNNQMVNNDQPIVSRITKDLVSKEPGLSLTEDQIENYHGIKIKLTTRNHSTPIKTLLITAPTTGVGSTTMAVNFAQMLAQDSQIKVLLIDANLRFPRIHEIFNMEYDQVLSYMLTNPESSNSIFKKISKNLFILASDKHQAGPLTVFESEPFDTFLKAARDIFSYVILDGPPVNKFSDPLMIGSKVDGVILVVDSGKTRRLVALNAKKELQDSGANVLGVILNRRKYHIPGWLYDRL